MAGIELDGVGITRGEWSLHDVTLRIADGEVVALIGPSGAGKTTLLRLVAGLDELGAGEILIGGASTVGVPPGGRDLAMVRQESALLPHLPVRGNIGFPLRLRRLARREVDKRVEVEARVFGIRQLLERTPNTLSSGERQLTSVARMTVRQPAAYLMDEPLASLDQRERDRVRGELALFLRVTGVTTLYATNDQREAMTLADRIAVLRDGAILEVGAPDDLYQRPGNAFTASFLGDPGMNLLPTRLEAGGRTAWVRCDSGSLELRPLPSPLRTSWDGREVLAGMRPETVELVAGHKDEGGTARSPGIKATVAAVESLGPNRLLRATVTGPREPTVVAARLAPDQQAARGSVVRLSAPPREIHLFDPATGTAIWHGTAPP